MSFEPESFVVAAEVAPMPDMANTLRTFAKLARKARRETPSYPNRERLLGILASARASIDRINAESR